MYETPWIKVRRDEVLNHQGKALTYSVVELHHPSVFIVAANEVGDILLQKNYRYTIDQTIWELPAGHSEGRDILEAAQRELREEDGYESDAWTDLGLFYQATGVGRMPLRVCLAQNVKPVKGYHPEDGELILERRFIRLPDVEQMIMSGELINATSIGALYIAKLHGL